MYPVGTSTGYTTRPSKQSPPQSTRTKTGGKQTERCVWAKQTTRRRHIGMTLLAKILVVDEDWRVQCFPQTSIRQPFDTANSPCAVYASYRRVTLIDQGSRSKNEGGRRVFRQTWPRMEALPRGGQLVKSLSSFQIRNIFGCLFMQG